ncbi:hypothetical protein MMC12_007981 [Toensbergia leucococca]|nr:hypothetical protein [Toensbergia leucococca]
MSGKLDQSLDEILSSRRQTARRGGRGRRAPNPTRTSVAAPVGGIKKNTKVAKGFAKSAVPTGPAAGNGESKVIVSNLPPDVSEAQIKEYFVKSVGPVKRVTITYGPNGVSRGIATIIFSKPGSGNDALVKVNGLLVDKRPMKIEVVLDASRAPPPAPIKGLSERIVYDLAKLMPTAYLKLKYCRQPKNQPKLAVATKATPNGTTSRGGRGRGRGVRRGRNAGRPKVKTAEELDAEMVDYFDATGANGGPAGTDAAATTNGAIQPITNGGDDLGMDEIS